MASTQKKFVMKPFTVPKAMDVAGAKKLWSTLENAIDQIYDRNSSSLSFEELYRSAYNLVLNKHGDMLYSGVSNTIRSHLHESVGSVASAPNETLLMAISSAWEDHKITINMVKDVLMYMDKTYVQQHKKNSVYNMSVLIFREVMLYNGEVRDRLRALLLGNVENERRGLLVDKDLMKKVLSMLGDLCVDGVNVYEEDFEKPFLDASRTFYRQESQEYLVQNNCPDFMIKAENRIEEEQMRVRSYLSSSTGPKLKHLMDYEYITSHSHTLLEMESSGFIHLLKDNKHDDLKRMYTLFGRVGQTIVATLHEAMGNYVKVCGNEIISDQETSKDPVAFVQAMLDLKFKFDKIINECFKEEKKAMKKLKEAFEDFVNKDTRCASHLASFVDDLLKSGLKGMTEADAETRLDNVMVIFRYLSDKDIFENIYRGHLAKRLLHCRSVSDDCEKLMISKLKGECGQQFTSKMEGMFLDVNLSKEIMEDYKTSENFKTLPIEMDVQTLTTSHWALKGAPPLSLPGPLTDCIERFTAYYLQKFKTGRRLTWLTNLGSVDLKASFQAGRRDLNVSTYQMCILLQFNDRDELPLEHIRAGCGNCIPEAELRRHLLSLCTPKLRILKKSSKGKGIEDDDVITFNAEFTSKFKRIKVPLVSAKDVQKEDSTGVLPASVEEDRRHLVEASIVRIMKARKRASHNDLIAEVTRQLSLRFSPTPQFIKNRVESLIERDYLARDKDDRRMYNYLA